MTTKQEEAVCKWCGKTSREHIGIWQRLCFNANDSTRYEPRTQAAVPAQPAPNALKPLCLDQSENGCLCTLSPNHEGDHTAIVDGGYSIVKWPKPIPPTSAPLADHPTWAQDDVWGYVRQLEAEIRALKGENN